MQIIRNPNPDVDILANNLQEWGRFGRKCPPSWDGAKHSFPVSGPQGERIGNILPGRGLYLDHDLKSLGITRRIPHVFQRSETSKITEALGSERNAVKLIAFRDRALRYGCERTDVARAAITTYDGIIAARAGGLGQDIFIGKASMATVGGIWYSMMVLAGAGTIATLSGLAAGSSTPGAGGSVMTRATTGAWSLGLTNPSAGHGKYLLTFGYTAAQQINMLMLVDLLVGVSGISSNSATNNVNSIALTRQTSGVGVWPVMETTTAPSAGSFNWAGTYVGVPSGTTFQATACVSAQIAGRIQPNATGFWVCPQLAAGDYGLTSVTTITTSAQFASGVFNLYLAYPLGMIPGLAQNIYAERDSTVQIDGLTTLPIDGSNVLGCLGAFVVSATTSTGIFQAFLRTCEG